MSTISELFKLNQSPDLIKDRLSPTIVSSLKRASSPNLKEHTLNKSSDQIMIGTPISRQVIDKLSLTIQEPFTTFNYPIKKWSDSKWGKNLPKMAIDEKISKQMFRKKHRMLKLKELAIPLESETLASLLEVVEKLKEQFKKSSNQFTFPLAYDFIINNSNFRLDIYDRTDGKGKDFFLVDRGYLIDDGMYKKIYRAWTLSKKPSLKAYAISGGMMDPSKLNTSVKEAYYLQLLHSKLDKNAKCLTPIPFKCTYLQKDNAIEQIIIMKYYPSNGLKLLMNEIMNKKNRVSDRKKIEYALTLAQAIEYLHSKGIIHRDIKPENFLVNKLGRLVICDFGYACQLSPSISGYIPSHITKHELNQLKGSPKYLAYEKLKEAFLESNHHASTPISKTLWDANKAFSLDIWSLGYIYWILFSERNNLWDAEEEVNIRNSVESTNSVEVKIKIKEFTQQSLIKAISQINKFNNEIPKENHHVRALVRKMLDISPEKRPHLKMIVSELEKMLLTLPLEDTFNIRSQFS